ncbi:hypothetical protein [Actinotignum sanguinis]|uniref:hypothetical protein n=1 Tax=Actinotignum sanguinis TaxID=1445614 RepID=UPI00254A6ABB|nr:hypothetical protein [Actinotignum sanguinis]MDK8657716.1 hypothetical protein [Actinotignum sanguinis]
MKRIFSITTLLLVTGLSLTACSSGSSIEGTYLSTSTKGALKLESGGKCGYKKTYNPEKELEVEDDCAWSLSGSNLTLVGVSCDVLNVFGQGV